MNYASNYNSSSITHDLKQKGYRTGMGFGASLNTYFSGSDLSKYSMKKDVNMNKITEESFPNEIFSKSNYFSNFKDLINDKYNFQRSEFLKPQINPYPPPFRHINPNLFISKNDFEMRKSQSIIKIPKSNFNGSPSPNKCYYISRDEDPNVTPPHFFGIGYIKKKNDVLEKYQGFNNIPGFFNSNSMKWKTQEPNAVSVLSKFNGWITVRSDLMNKSKPIMMKTKISEGERSSPSFPDWISTGNKFKPRFISNKRTLTDATAITQLTKPVEKRRIFGKLLYKNPDYNLYQNPLSLVDCSLSNKTKDIIK